jgi:LmeA-like phospholipid-binding
MSWRRSRTRRRERRRARWPIAVIVIILVLLGLDFGTKAIAESVAATQIQKQAKLTTKPAVTFVGFPFLTQLVTRDFPHVNISIANLTEGPVTFTSVDATATAVKPTSFTFQQMTIGHISGTALIDYASLGDTLASQFGALGSLLHGAGLDLSGAGPQEVKATINLVVTSGSATWRIVQVGPRELHVRLVGSSGLPSSLLDSLQNLDLRIPPLPLGLTLDRVTVTRAGVVGTISGSNVSVGS